MLPAIPGWSHVEYPMLPEAWEVALAGHPDDAYRMYLVKGLREGFRIGLGYGSMGPSTQADLSSDAKKDPVLWVFLQPSAYWSLHPYIDMTRTQSQSESPHVNPLPGTCDRRHPGGLPRLLPKPQVASEIRHGSCQVPPAAPGSPASCHREPADDACTHRPQLCFLHYKQEMH